MTNEMMTAGGAGVPAREVREIALEINAIKQQTFRTALMAAVEIGRLLCEAKEGVPHGEWGAWLQVNVAYSVSTANNMMRLWRERENMAQLDMFSTDSWDMFEGMSPTKVLALLDVPAGERREFIEQTGADAEDVSVSDVKAAIKARREAEERAKSAEERADSAEVRAVAAEDEVAHLRGQIESLDVQLALAKSIGASDEERKRIEKEAAEKAKSDADKKIAAAKKKAEQELERAKKEGADAVKKVEAERDAAIERARADAKVAAERESAAKIALLEDKLKAQTVAASPHMERFKAHLTAFQDAYRRMLDVVADAENEAPDVAAQLRRAMDELVKRLIPQAGGQ